MTIKQLTTFDDLTLYWPAISSFITAQQSRSPTVNIDYLLQHCLHIINRNLEGWIGINLDNNDVMCFIVMKRKLSLMPEILEYDTLYYHFSQGYRKPFFSLLDSFFQWAKKNKATRCYFETLAPTIFLKNRDIIQLEKHSITLKKEF